MPGENLIDLCRQRHMPTVDAASIAGIVLICVNGTCHNTWTSLVPQVVKNRLQCRRSGFDPYLIPRLKYLNDKVP